MYTTANTTQAANGVLFDLEHPTEPKPLKHIILLAALELAADVAQLVEIADGCAGDAWRGEKWHFLTEVSNLGERVRGLTTTMCDISDREEDNSRKKGGAI
jgi:hypothetical protein